LSETGHFRSANMRSAALRDSALCTQHIRLSEQTDFPIW